MQMTLSLQMIELMEQADVELIDSYLLNKQNNKMGNIEDRMSIDRELQAGEQQSRHLMECLYNVYEKETNNAYLDCNTNKTEPIFVCAIYNLAIEDCIKAYVSVTKHPDADYIEKLKRLKK